MQGEIMAYTQIAEPALLQPADDARATPRYDMDIDHDSVTAARGVLTAIFIAAPFWALVAFTFYLLL